MLKMHIDTDGGSDDVIAIAMALTSKDCEVDEITCSYGNVELEQSFDNVSTLVSLVYLKNANKKVKVIPGFKEPLFNDMSGNYAYETHGLDGLSDKGLSKHFPLKYYPLEAIVSIVNAVENKERIVCLGPLTNIAMACKLYPDDMTNADLWIMGTGGLNDKCNVFPHVEYNMYCDPEAFQIVSETCVNIHIIGWDICISTPEMFISQADCEKLKRSRLGKWLVNANETLFRLNRSRFDDWVLDAADPVAMAVAMNPDEASFCVSSYSVDVNEGVNYGSVNFDPHDSFTMIPFNMSRVCSHFPANEFKRLLLKDIPTWDCEEND